MWLVGLVGFCLLVIGGVVAGLFLKSVFAPVAREFRWFE